MKGTCMEGLFGTDFEINIGKSEFLKNESTWGGAIFNDFQSKMTIYKRQFLLLSYN